MRSTSLIRDLVKQEIDGSAPGLNGHGVPSNRIVVGGFSQGGAIALLAGLTSPSPIAGVVALSTWMPLRAKIEAMRTSQELFPVFQAHGTADQIVNYEFGKATHEGLRTQLGFGKLAEFHEYKGMMHSACPEEIRDLGQWLERVVPI